MAAVAKRDLYQVFKRDRRLRREAIDPVADLPLSALQDAPGALKKINGHAVHMPTPDHPPTQECHEAIERLTGFGDFDPVAAAEDPALAEQYRRKFLEMKAVRIQAQLNTNVTVGETTAFRTLCVYRIVRELARIKGCISADETLADVNFWKNPPLISKYQAIEPLYKARQSVIQPVISTVKQFEDFLGAPVPFEPPRNDKDVGRCFSFVAEEVADSLYLHRGSTILPDYGILGLKGLFDPRVSYLIWPSRHELVSMEELLIEEVVRLFTKMGESGAKRRLVSKYGLLQHEAIEIVHMAFNHSRNTMVSDKELQRTKVVLQLYQTVEDSLTVGDTRAQISALTQIAKVLGLMEDQEDDFNEEMAKTIRELRDKEYSPPERPEIVMDAK